MPQQKSQLYQVGHVDSLFAVFLDDGHDLHLGLVVVVPHGHELKKYQRPKNWARLEKFEQTERETNLSSNLS